MRAATSTTGLVGNAIVPLPAADATEQDNMADYMTVQISADMRAATSTIRHRAGQQVPDSRIAGDLHYWIGWKCNRAISNAIVPLPAADAAKMATTIDDEQAVTSDDGLVETDNMRTLAAVTSPEYWENLHVNLHHYMNSDLGHHDDNEGKGPQDLVSGSDEDDGDDPPDLTS